MLSAALPHAGAMSDMPKPESAPSGECLGCILYGLLWLGAAQLKQPQGTWTVSACQAPGGTGIYNRRGGQGAAHPPERHHVNQ